MSFDHNLNDRLRRLYRGPRREVTRRDENGVEWQLLDEIDLATGETCWYGDYKPFAQTPFDQWKPRHW